MGRSVFSKAGNGVSHPVHMQRFGVPGKTLIGSDSHTCAVELSGELPPWVSAKDVILEMLRRHGVKGGVNRIIEYHGDGLARLSAMDRHVIANMGAELGATTSVFPADEAVRDFLRGEGREDAYVEVLADNPSYDVIDSTDLSALEPLIARPSSPDNVVPVREVAGKAVHQVVIGSSANPGLRDFAIVAETVRDRQAHDQVSFDVNPSSRQILSDLTHGGWLADLVPAGARIHQSGCMGCIGMGQAPLSGGTACARCPATFPAVRARKRTRCGCARPRPPPHPR